MAISVDPLTDIIYVPKADLTLLQASPEVRELDLDWFRLELRDWEDGEDAIPRPKTHTHNTQVTLAGLTYARIIEILDPYTVEFEDGQYTINCVGANHNLSDRKVANQVSLIVNNAAGLITNTAIEYSSFQGAVHLNTSTSYTGTVFPVGTPQRPVNNLIDALQIASTRGFAKLVLYNDIDLDDSYNLDGFTIQGVSESIVLTIDSIASVNDLTLRNLTIADSTLDGNVDIRDCLVRDVSYVNGYIHNCGLAGTITLGGDRKSVIADCYTVDQDDTPTIDMGGSGNDLAMPNYSGVVTFSNLSGASNELGVGLDAGAVTLDSTITGGSIVVSGIGLLFDNSNSGAVINTDGILNKSQISETVWEAIGGVVYLNPSSSYSGTEYPIGTPQYPVNNLSDAKLICERVGVERIHIHGEVVFDTDFSGYIFESHDVDAGSADLNGRNLSNVTFYKMNISGSVVGHINLRDCDIMSGLTNLDCHMENCILQGTFVAASEGTINGDRCTSATGVVFDLNGNGNLGMANWSGLITIANISNAASTIGLTGNYLLNLMSSCTNGVGLIAGIGIVNDYSNGLNVTERTLPHAVWNTVLTASTYNLPTSAGRRLRQLSSGIIIEGEVVSATTNTISFDGDASDVDGAYDPATISIVDGTGNGQSRLILEYHGSTKTAVVDRDWKIQPDDTSKFVIVSHPGREHVNEGLAQGGTINTITLNTLASDNDEAYTGQTIFIRSGTGMDQAQKVESYNGTTKVATLCKDWAVIPDTTSAYVMLPTGHFDGEELIERTVDGVWSHVDALAIMSDLSFVKKIEGGRWHIVGNEMIFYDDDNTTEIARFTLSYDVNGNPNQRVRI